MTAVISEPLLTRTHDRWTLELIRPTDGPALDALFADCSPASIHQRFFGQMRRLPRAYLHSALAGPPEVHDAVVARFRVGDGRIAALAGLAATVDRPHEAELGVLVADACQGRGLGSALVDLLLDRARDRGVVRVGATVLPGRFELLAALARRLAYAGSSCTSDGLASVYMLSSAVRSARPLPPRQPPGGAP